MGPSKGFSSHSRSDGSMSRGGAYGTSPHETDSVVLDVFLGSKLKGAGSSCSDQQSLDSTPRVVAEGQKPLAQGPSRGRRSGGDSDYRLKLTCY